MQVNFIHTSLFISIVKHNGIILLKILRLKPEKFSVIIYGNELYLSPNAESVIHRYCGILICRMYRLQQSSEEQGL